MKEVVTDDKASVIQLTGDVQDGFSVRSVSTLVEVEQPIGGKYRILVDCGDHDFSVLKEALLQKAESEGQQAITIDIAVFTHSHLDHIAGFSYLDPTPQLLTAESLEFKPWISVIPDLVWAISTPGHMDDDVSVVVQVDNKVVVIAGDIFENETDDGEFWKEESQHPTMQARSRDLISCLADFIVPGHGEAFVNMFSWTLTLDDSLLTAVAKIERVGSHWEVTGANDALVIILDTAAKTPFIQDASSAAAVVLVGSRIIRQAFPKNSKKVFLYNELFVKADGGEYFADLWTALPEASQVTDAVAFCRLPSTAGRVLSVAVVRIGPSEAVVLPGTENCMPDWMLQKLAGGLRAYGISSFTVQRGD